VNRAPSREEVDSRVSEAQRKLAELKHAQEELERERSGLEETRRRQIEFQTGREESIRNLTRAVGLLTESEFAARRDAEQMVKALVDLKDALTKVEATSEQGWTKDNFTTELTKALTVIENAQMEWNTARLKFPILSGNALEQSGPAGRDGRAAIGWPREQGFFALCKLGLALTWPLAAVLLLVGIILIALRH
jgi:DNA repair exonuclease SbcCD ATPase subunit